MKMLNSVLFKRILVVFIVGLISRSIINYTFGVNVFKECAEFISFIYYSYMVFFTVFVSELPNITISNLSISSFKKSVATFYDSYYLGRDKMELGGKVGDVSKIGDVSKEDFAKKQLFLTKNTSGEYSSSSRGSGGRSSAGRRSAGLAGLYGNSNGGRSTRTPAGIVGLYGNNGGNSSRVSNHTNDTYNSDNRDRRHINSSDDRDRRYYDSVRNRPIRKVFTGNEAEYERVSGFNSNNSNASNNSNNRTGYRDNVEYNARRVNSTISFEYEAVNPSNLRKVDTIAIIPQTGINGSAPARIESNPYYAPSELAISIQGSAAGSVVDQSENFSRASSVSRENTVPRAPRPSNYSTPETMSPLFPSSEVSSRRSLSTRSSNGEKLLGVRQNNWNSFYSRSPVINGSTRTSDSDVRRMKDYHQICREMSENISSRYNKMDVKHDSSSSARKIKGIFSGRK